MVVHMRDPFATLAALQNAMDRAMRSDWFGSRTSGTGAYPPINVFRQGEDFVLLAEIPGVRKDAVDVEVKGDEVRIKGNKEIDYGENVSVHRRERVPAQFDRTLSLPFSIDPEHVKAEYHDGVLALRLPRAEREKPRSVSLE